jgi:hypothetical protein
LWKRREAVKLKLIAEVALVVGAVGIGIWHGLSWDRIVLMAVLAFLIPTALTQR